MAKLSAHGHELLRIERLNCRIAHMSDGHILRDCGDGWKKYRRVKPGIDPVEHANNMRHFLDNPPPQVHFRKQLRKRFVAEWPGLEHRIRAFVAFDMLGSDIDGIWSELEDAGIGTDMDTIKELRELWVCATQEGNEVAERKLKAAQAAPMQTPEPALT